MIAWPILLAMTLTALALFIAGICVAGELYGHLPTPMAVGINIGFAACSVVFFAWLFRGSL